MCPAITRPRRTPACRFDVIASGDHRARSAITERSLLALGGRSPSLYAWSLLRSAIAPPSPTPHSPFRAAGLLQNRSSSSLAGGRGHSAITSHMRRFAFGTGLPLHLGRGIMDSSFATFSGVGAAALGSSSTSSGNCLQLAAALRRLCTGPRPNRLLQPLRSRGLVLSVENLQAASG